MKNDVFKTISSLEKINGKLQGGFAPLNTKQMSHIHGGANTTCTNTEFCSGTNTKTCTNVATPTCTGSNTGTCDPKENMAEPF